MDLKRFHLIEKANLIAESIWEEVVNWNYFEKDTVGKQLVRSADSISANLSEAHGRYTFPERKRFAYYARGSLCETNNWIDLCIKRGLINETLGNQVLLDLQKLSVQISRYIRYLNRNNPTPAS